MVTRLAPAMARAVKAWLSKVGPKAGVRATGAVREKNGRALEGSGQTTIAFMPGTFQKRMGESGIFSEAFSEGLSP
jgi:hypothetical protein